MKKKFLSLLLAAAMLCSFIVLPAAAEEPAEAWYNEAMTVWSERGVLQGDEHGNLNPTASITRAELAVMMDRIMVYQAVAENAFTDVENGAWYTDAVLKANAAGVLQGSGAYARPLDTITRQEVMVLMTRALDLDGKPDAVASFADADQVASWARDAVGAMVSAGYISGNNGSIMPAANITRAEVAVMMDNIFGAVYAQAGTYTENVDSSVVINTDQVVLKNMTISGDLIVAEGVGNGKVTLDNVAVKGRIIVRGGSVITIQGSSTADTILAERRDAPTEISLEDKTNVDTVVVPEDSADHIVIDVSEDAQIGSVIIGADNTDLNVSGKVRTVTVDDTASGTTVNTEKGAEIDSVITSGEDTSVEGKGTVSKVEATEGASDTTVTTPGTKVENNSSEPVTTDKGTIGAGETGTTSGSNSSSGGSSGGGTPSHTHSYAYTDNGNGTHTGVCPADNNTVTEAHDTNGPDGTCSKCGAAQKATSAVSVKDSEGKILYADTLKEAIDAAAAGSTITLLTDVEYTEGNINVARDLVLNLNGHAVTSTATFEFGRNNSYGDVPVEVTVKNGIWNIKGTSGRLRFENGCTGTFEDMTFRSVDTSLAQALQSYADTKDSKNVYTFTNCTFENSYLSFEGASVKSYDYDIDITGCTFQDFVLGNGRTCVMLEDYLYGTADIIDTTFTYTANGNNASAVNCDGYKSYLGENVMAVTLNNVTTTAALAGSGFSKGYTTPVYVKSTDATEVTLVGTNSFTRDGYAIPYDSLVCEYSANGVDGWTKRNSLERAPSGNLQPGSTVRLIWDNDGKGYGESFTLPVGLTFDTNGLNYTGTVSAPSGCIVVYDETAGTYISVKPTTVSSESELTEALANDSVSVIMLGASFEVTAQISVSRPVVIDGSNKTISIGNDTTWSTANGYKHLVDVGADGVTIKNLTLDSNGKAYGLQGYQVSGMVLENVTALNSKGSGLTVNGSSVAAAGLTISGSGWNQSIDLSRGGGVTAPATLTLDTVSGLKDAVQICQDDACDANVTVNNTAWYAEGYYNSSNNDFKYIYTDDVTATQHGQIRVPAGEDAKANGALLQAAMTAAPAGSTIVVSSGTYDLPRGTNTVEGQTGWYFAIVQDGLTLVGEDMPVLTSTVYAANGVWATQNFITILGDNVTLDGFIIKCKMDCNKAIEIGGKNSALLNLEIRCNDLLSEAGYDAQAPANDYWEFYRNGFAGSLCYTGDVGEARLEHIYVEKAWLTVSFVTDGTITMKDVTLDFSGSWYSGVNLPVSDNAAAYLKDGSELTVTIDSNVTADQFQKLLDILPEGAVVRLTTGEYQTEAGSWTVNKALTLEGSEGAVLKSGLTVTADGVTLKDITMNVTITAMEQSAPITSTGDLTLIGCNISRATEVAQPYGMLVAVKNKLTAVDTDFIAPYDPETAFNASPSVIEAGEVDLDGCTIATDGYGLFSQHVTKGIIENTIFTGIDGRPILGCFNSTVLNGLTFDGCTFDMGYNSIVAAGSFTIRNSTFDFADTPADGAGNGINLYAQNGPVVLTNNAFKLTAGKKGINLTSASWAAGDHDASQVTITGNIFEGTGDCAIKVSEAWTSVPTSDTYAGSNTLNGNAVYLPTT